MNNEEKVIMKISAEYDPESGQMNVSTSGTINGLSAMIAQIIRTTAEKPDIDPAILGIAILASMMKDSRK